MGDDKKEGDGVASKKKGDLVFVLFVLILILALGVFVFVGMFQDKYRSSSVTGAVVGEEIPEPLKNEENNTEENEDIGSVNYKIYIEEFSFNPRELRIKVGDSVTWINSDQVKAQIVFSNDLRAIKSGKILGGGQYYFTFEESGRFTVWSAIDEFSGVIIVE